MTASHVEFSFLPQLWNVLFFFSLHHEVTVGFDTLAGTLIGNDANANE